MELSALYFLYNNDDLLSFFFFNHLDFLKGSWKQCDLDCNYQTLSFQRKVDIFCNDCVKFTGLLCILNVTCPFFLNDSDVNEREHNIAYSILYHVTYWPPSLPYIWFYICFSYQRTNISSWSYFLINLEIFPNGTAKRNTILTINLVFLKW